MGSGWVVDGYGWVEKQRIPSKKIGAPDIVKAVFGGSGWDG